MMQVSISENNSLNNWEAMLETPRGFTEDSFSFGEDFSDDSIASDASDSSYSYQNGSPPLPSHLFDSFDNLDKFQINEDSKYNNNSIGNDYSPITLIDQDYTPSQIPDSLFSAPDGTYVNVNPIQFPDSIQFDFVYRELPSRSIMMSNVPDNANEEDMEYVLKQFGPYESYDLSRIKEGVATANFYNIEDAERMRISQIVIRNRQIVTIFGDEIPVNDPKHPPNNGTIVVFHLPPNVDDRDIIKQFSRNGRIRQIRHTPNKETQRFIEFYDKRDAEKAQKMFNRQFFFVNNRKSKLSIEYSLPGSFRINNAKFYQTKLPTVVRKNTKVY
ncbi:hypothetical protein TRFO_27998 [Tritrichomonas foetus]|uniref:RRM domain-containing protein n=1 Tax=Tritrichomonas foetus TaxID=1144522 RepID=A0A1J4JZD9_9EUKA|nr:hypothetical protein TRFO_27998 [Tritrichomonas foetus]|eukprot:OHT04543.1 hypothetical protein TRFO_27998 [Tritrichomonas foetus]